MSFALASSAHFAATAHGSSSSMRLLGLRLRAHAVAYRPALHEEDGMVAVLAFHRGRQPDLVLEAVIACCVGDARAPSDH